MRLPDVVIPKPIALLLCLGGLVPELLVPNGGIALLVAAPVALLLSGEARAAILRWAPGPAGREIAIGLTAGVLFAAVSMLVIDPMLAALLHEKTDLSSFANLRGNLANTLVFMLLAWVIGGLLEEVSARAMVIGWGSKLLGERWTVPLFLLSTLCFGAAHLYQGRMGAISAGISGLLFGLLYLWRRKTLLTPIMAHGMFDTIGIAAIYLGLNLA